MSLIPIKSASETLADLVHAIKDLESERKVLNNKFLEAMTLYNQRAQEAENLKNEVDWLRANQQKNAKHYNQCISELALKVGSKRISWKTAEGGLK